MKQADVEAWNRFWEEPDAGLQWKHGAAAELVENEPVLDVGCGSGLLLELLRDKGLRFLVGCDVASSSVRRVRDKGLDVIRCDAEKALPFRSGSFATATLVDVLEHTWKPADLLAEAARVAREVVVVVPNFNSLVARSQVVLGRVPENNTPRKRHAYWFNLDVLASTAAAAGLELATTRLHTFRHRDSLLGPPFRLLGRMRPQLFALAFAVRLRRP